MKHFVVTIGREYGSLGLAIGKKLAELLNVEYYDRDLVEIAAEELNKDISEISHVDEVHSIGVGSFISPSGLADTKLLNKVIDTQSRIIREKAENESCVIVGRCADYVLRDRSDCINVFIFAPYDKRVERIYQRHKDDGTIIDKIKAGKIEDISREIEAEIKKIDTARKNYYRYVTGNSREEINGKHILINSNLLGVDGTAEYLRDLVARIFS